MVYHNEPSDPKGNANIISTVVKFDHTLHTITKTRLFKYIENFTTKKKGKFSDKKILIVFKFMLKT